MGRKVHPLGFRIGTIRDWQAKWYADKHYPEFIQEDVKIRKAIRSRYAEAGVSLVEIERQANRVTITIYTSRPGIVIGRGGQRVDETRHYLEELVGKRVQLNIQEIRQPELDAYLVAKMVAEQMERRIAYRRAMKQALFRTMQAGAKGMRITCSGRLGGVEIARRQMMHQGRVPLHTLRADIDYGFTEAHTTLGRIGIKVWIYRGDILPEVEELMEEVVAAPAVEEVTKTETAAEGEKKPLEEVVKKKEAAPVDKEEKEVKPKAKKVVKKKAIGKEEKPVEEKAFKKAEKAPVAKKDVKPKAKRVTKKKPKAEEEKPVEEKAAEKKEEKKTVEKEKEVKPKAKKEVTKKTTTKEEEKTAEKKEAIKKKPATEEKKTETKEVKKKAARKKADKTESESKAEEIKEEKADAATEKGKIQKKS